MRDRAAPGARAADLRAILGRLEDPLELLAEDVLGLESRIDAVARDRRGGAVVVLRPAVGAGLEAVADALAQARWLEPRLPDWLKLAPDLGLRPERGARGLVLSNEISPRMRAAAAATQGRVELQRMEAPTAAWAAPAASLPPRALGPAGEPVRLRSVFRTALQDGDLDLRT